MKAQQQNIDNIANNIANIETTGYKKTRVDFKDAMYSAMQNPADIASQNNLQIGNGVLIDATLKLFDDGPLIETGRTLDFAIAGEGFFAVQDSQGRILYTRDGVFNTSNIEGRNYLVNSSGYLVLDKNNNPIVIEGDINNLIVDAKGVMTIDGEHVADLGIFTFDNPSGLEAVGSTSYIPSDNSGEARAAGGAVKQKYYEGSNVDITKEMTSLIKAQRAYSLLSQAVKTADQMESMANNLRG